MRNRSRRLALSILFFGVAISVSAQVGRVEVTMDTVPVGGEEQRAMMSTMEAHDRLSQDLILLRDSSHTFLKTLDAKSAASKSLSASDEQLSQLIVQFKKSEGSAALYRKGTNLLDEKRREFNAFRRTPNSSE
jgi:hypothetical protein